MPAPDAFGSTFPYLHVLSLDAIFRCPPLYGAERLPVSGGFLEDLLPSSCSVGFYLFFSEW